MTNRRIFVPGRGLILPVREIATNPLAVQMQGFFRFIKNGKVIAETADLSPNLILDSGLNAWGTLAPVPTVPFMMIGTGTATPVASQTGLQAQTASSNTGGVGGGNSYVPGPPPYCQSIYSTRFAEGVGTGTISEVGIGWNSTSCWSRALVLDNVGSPTTITKAADESLDIQYVLRVYPPTTDATGSFVINSVTYNYTMRACNVGASPTGGSYWSPANLFGGQAGYSSANSNSIDFYPAASVLGPITGVPSGSASAGFTDVTRKAYVSNSNSMGLTAKYKISTSAPAGGIGAAGFTMFGTIGFKTVQVGFSPAIPKTLANEFTFEPRISWARRP